MADLEKIKERVMAMLAKAGDPAATEDEALAAMTMARKLMDKHGLSAKDCEKATGDDFMFFEWEAGRSKKGAFMFHPVDRLICSTIAKFAGVRYFYKTAPDSSQKLAMFFGLESDVALAEWMRATLIQQFDKDWENYLYVDRKNRALSRVKDARISFAKAFAGAVNSRFDAWLFRSTPDGDGYTNALVFKKQDLVTDELGRRGWHIHTTTYMGPPVNDGLAAGAGYNAGKAARLSVGVSNSPHMMITGKV